MAELVVTKHIRIWSGIYTFVHVRKIMGKTHVYKLMGSWLCQAVASVQLSTWQQLGVTSSACPGRSWSSLRDFRSHTLSVESELPLHSRRLSADQDTWYTRLTWPRSVARNLHVYKDNLNARPCG